MVAGLRPCLQITLITDYLGVFPGGWFMPPVFGSP